MTIIDNLVFGIFGFIIFGYIFIYAFMWGYDVVHLK
jgi:hypothetical protein